jgi:hypothetical protein
MGVLTQDMRDILASAMLAFVATVRRDGSQTRLGHGPSLNELVSASWRRW